jgi:RimJ/RimL family protein N-acetyltransferase
MFIFETERLSIRVSSAEDAELYHALWTDPKVMANVGFPYGLRSSIEEVVKQLRDQQVVSEFGRNLVVELKTSPTAIGECKMYEPDENGVSKTDVKLLPEFWGNRYGVETKQGLVDYLFENSGCLAVEATPNRDNVPSIKMQEAVGGVRVGEGIRRLGESQTTGRVADDWESRRRLGESQTTGRVADDWESRRRLGAT